MKFFTSTRLALLGLAALFAGAGRGEVRTLEGPQTADIDWTLNTDSTINLKGVTFTNCGLKLRGDKTYTINLVDGTTNVFTQELKNDCCIKATKASNLVITGGGTLSVMSTKKLKSATGGGVEDGVITCNNLTVVGGETKVVFDNNKCDSPCILVKGDYRQLGGKMKVEASKKNCTNEFYGVYLDTAGSTFTLEGGTFNAEFAGTKSRAINLKKSSTATFKGGKCKMEFEGPDARFVSGGTVVVEDGEFTFTTNITAKMTQAFYPTGARGIKADYSITVSGGDFEADLPLPGSEVFETDAETGTFIDISGGDFDLVSGNDCMNAHTHITVSGGRIRGRSLEDDILDANNNMTISGGIVRAFATANGTHGLDVNKNYMFRITGGNVIATDGPSSEKLKLLAEQTTFYGDVPRNDISGKYLVVPGSEGVTKVCVPELADAAAIRLLVSVPGQAADWAPVGQTLAEAYSDYGPSTPLVFERKVTVTGNTITTREGDVLVIPDAYTLEPSSGKTKVVTLKLNVIETDPGFAGIRVVDGQVRVDVPTTAGLNYQLVTADEPTAASPWTAVGDAVAGDGTVRTLVAPQTADKAFYRVKVAK